MVGGTPGTAGREGGRVECLEFCGLTLDWSIQKAGAEIKAPEGKNIPWKGRSLSNKGSWGAGPGLHLVTVPGNVFTGDSCL